MNNYDRKRYNIKRVNREAELIKRGTLAKEGSVYSVVGEFPNVYSLKKLQEYAERNKVEPRVKFNSKVDIYEIARKAKIIS